MTPVNDDRSEDELGLEGIQAYDSTSSALLEQPTGRFTAPPSSTSDPSVIVRQAFPFGDAVAALVVCRRHSKLALSQVDSQKGLWLPVLPVKQGESTKKILAQLMMQVMATSEALSLGNERFKAPQRIHEMRLQVPSLNFVSRSIFYVELTEQSPESCPCAVNNVLVSWYEFSQLYSLSNLWGIEPIVYAKFLAITTGAAIFNPSQAYDEMFLEELTAIWNADLVLQEMLKQCEATIDDLLFVYGDWSQHCYPAQCMILHSFCDYIKRTGIDLGPKKLPPFFRAFSHRMEQGYLNCVEFIKGLLALDKAVSHGKETGRERCKYIFRYYQTSQPVSCGKDSLGNDIAPPTTGPLQFDIDEFAAELLRTFDGMTMPLTQEAINAKKRSLYEAMNISQDGAITQQVFIEAVGLCKIRGTSLLFRAENSPLKQIKTRPLYGAMTSASRSTSFRRSNPYFLAAHTVKLNAYGRIIDPRRNPLRVQKTTNQVNRKKSNEMFRKNVYNRLIDHIVQFEEALQKKKRTSEWEKNRAKCFKDIISVCENVKKVLAAESRILKIGSPVYVLGDLHGNLQDLMLFEQQFWRTGPSCLPTNYLFLGDYVDRGDYGVEVITYLLCFKMLVPDRFWLLRGNHEIRVIQKDFTFFTECIDKFGKKNGETLWESFNQVFDVMPICAVIDEQIFCAHGGIPASVTKLQDLQNAIPCPMSDPETQSQPAWEVLWNDPITDREYKQILNNKDQSPTSSRIQNGPCPAGFTHNYKRATAFCFSGEAAASFLALNSLSFIIRGHEVVPEGYDFHADGKVITVFSSSNYCQGNNSASCILVDGIKIRVIQKMDIKKKT